MWTVAKYVTVLIFSSYFCARFSMKCRFCSFATASQERLLRHHRLKIASHYHGSIMRVLTCKPKHWELCKCTNSLIIRYFIKTVHYAYTDCSHLEKQSRQVERRTRAKWYKPVFKSTLKVRFQRCATHWLVSGVRWVFVKHSISSKITQKGGSKCKIVNLSLKDKNKH